jgi:hypothetical protein
LLAEPSLEHRIEGEHQHGSVGHRAVPREGHQLTL